MADPSDRRRTGTRIPCRGDDTGLERRRELQPCQIPGRPPGFGPLSAEEDFPEPGQNSTGFEDTPIGGFREPLDLQEGWREYGFEWNSPELTGGTLHFSIGVSVVWETGWIDYVDDVELTLRTDRS